MSTDFSFFKRGNRDNLYKQNGHVPNITVTKYTFDTIDKEFPRLKPCNYNTKIEIYYPKHIPNDCDCALLNCANSDAPNAGFRINRSTTQEGQLFNDSDIYAANFYNDNGYMHPF